MSTNEFWKNAIKAHGQPTENTVGYKGRHYIDLDTGTEYICVGVVNQDDHVPCTSKVNDFVTVERFIPKTTYVWQEFEDGSSGSGILPGAIIPEVVCEVPERFRTGEYDTDDPLIDYSEIEDWILGSEDEPPSQVIKYRVCVKTVTDVPETTLLSDVYVVVDGEKIMFDDYSGDTDVYVYDGCVWIKKNCGFYARYL